MIDTRDKRDKLAEQPPRPILRCPKCQVLYAPVMAKCARCGGPLEPVRMPPIGPKPTPVDL